MTALAALIVCALVATAAAGCIAGMLLERDRWQRRRDMPACWRCEGTGAEPTREYDTSGRWREGLR